MVTPQLASQMPGRADIPAARLEEFLKLLVGAFRGGDVNGTQRDKDPLKSTNLENLETSIQLPKSA